MSKAILTIAIVVLGLSACTETNNRVMNHATGIYYDLDHVNDKNWTPLFGHLTRVKTKLDEGWLK